MISIIFFFSSIVSNPDFSIYLHIFNTHPTFFLFFRSLSSYHIIHLLYLSLISLIFRYLSIARIPLRCPMVIFALSKCFNRCPQNIFHKINVRDTTYYITFLYIKPCHPQLSSQLEHQRPSPSACPLLLPPSIDLNYHHLTFLVLVIKHF